MINSSDSWMSEAQSWLVMPCTYTTAKCLTGRVHALQVGQMFSVLFYFKGFWFVYFTTSHQGAIQDN